MTSSPRNALAIAAIALAFAGVAFIYTTHPDRVPPYLAHDEVQLELNAMSVAESGRGLDGARLPLFFSDLALGPYGREPVSVYATALVWKFLRRDEFAIRLASALMGLGNIALMFAVARRYFGSVWSGVAAALLFAVTPLHFFLSRVGIEVVFILPFVLGWLYFLFADRDPSDRRSAVTIAIATLLLGLSLYAYKSAQLVAPAYLAMTVALISSRPSKPDAPARRRLTLAAVAIGAFAIAVLPYAIASRLHPERYASFSRVYSFADPHLTPLQNLRDAVRYDSLSNRFKSWWESFNPQLMFFSGEGSWSDSTRRAGMFLLPLALPIAVGFYLALARPTRLRVFVALGFVLAAIPSFVLMETAVRRMITIMPFATLLAVEGCNEIARRWPFGKAIVSVVAIATAIHFAVYYRDYRTVYPLNSFMAWELNLSGAYQALAERDLAQGQRGRAVVMVANPYAQDYARLFLRKYGVAQLQPRTEFPSLVAGPVAVPSQDTTLVLRQLFSGEAPASACPQRGWQATAIVHEVVGNPSFVVCERTP